MYKYVLYIYIYIYIHTYTQWSTKDYLLDPDVYPFYGAWLTQFVLGNIMFWTLGFKESTLWTTRYVTCNSCYTTPPGRPL